MNNATRLSLAVCLLTALLPLSARAQGWIDVTPAGLPFITRARAFDFSDGTFEVYVWRISGEESRGYRMTGEASWDSVFVYTSWVCDPIHGDRETRSLQTLARSPEDSRLTLALFSRGGCITEGVIHVFRDTTGSISMNDEVFWFDDIAGAGWYAKLAFSPLDDSEVFMVVQDSLYYSADYGNTFAARSSPLGIQWSMHDYLAPSPRLHGVLFSGGYSTTYEVLRSLDAGLTWTQVLADEISPIEFSATDDSLLYAGSGSGVLRSTDLGATWENVFPGDIRFVEARKTDPSELFAATGGGDLYRSSNGGDDWALYNDTFSDVPVIGLYSMPDSDTLIVVTTTGVFKVFASYVLDAGGLSGEHPLQHSLVMNYPNPFNAVSNFGFRVSDLTDVTLVIYDVLGREVATLVNERLAPGTYQRQWDATGQPSGVYFYRLEAGGYVETRKLALLR